MTEKEQLHQTTAFEEQVKGTAQQEAAESIATDDAGMAKSNHTEDNPEVCFAYQDVDKLMATIEEKKRLLDESAERYKRLMADFDNFRRRVRQEKEELSSVVKQELICQLLPVLDNFERALTTSSIQDGTAILAGVELIYRQLVQDLEKSGMAAIQAVGTQFDPNLHEAVMRVDDSGKEEGLVVEELQKGYTVHGKVIRPSMVKVVGS